MKTGTKGVKTGVKGVKAGAKDTKGVKEHTLCILCTLHALSVFVPFMALHLLYL